MKIQILSDLHREFGSTAIPKVDADLIILAGDIAVKQNAIPWLREFCAGTPTVYISGNHEYYVDKLPKVAQCIESMTSVTNIHLWVYSLDRFKSIRRLETWLGPCRTSYE